MENLVYLFSCFLSCVILAGLTFRFMGDRYGKAFENSWIYRIAAAVDLERRVQAKKVLLH